MASIFDFIFPILEEVKKEGINIAVMSTCKKGVSGFLFSLNSNLIPSLKGIEVECNGDIKECSEYAYNSLKESGVTLVVSFSSERFRNTFMDILKSFISRKEIDFTFIKPFFEDYGITWYTYPEIPTIYKIPKILGLAKRFAPKEGPEKTYVVRCIDKKPVVALEIDKNTLYVHSIYYRSDYQIGKLFEKHGLKVTG